VNIILWKYDINKIKDIAMEKGAHTLLTTSISLQTGPYWNCVAQDIIIDRNNITLKNFKSKKINS
jgi:hypothetical protein